MQIHYRPDGDDSVAQLRLFILIALPDLERKKTLSRPLLPILWTSNIFHWIFLFSSEGVPKCPSLFLIVKGQSSAQTRNLVPVRGPGEATSHTKLSWCFHTFGNIWNAFLSFSSSSLQGYTSQWLDLQSHWNQNLPCHLVNSIQKLLLKSKTSFATKPKCFPALS